MTIAALIPDAPLDSAIDKTVQTNVTAVMAVFAGVTLIYSLVYWWRTGKPTFLLLFIAGGAMMALEPMVDTVGAVWFPEGNSWVAYTLWGRPIPVWLCLAYFFYFGIGVGVAATMMRTGLTRGRLWALFGLGMLADLVLETVLLHYDTYIYYGDQPLVLAHFPLWWAPVNSMIVMAAAALIATFDRYLAGIRQLAIIPIAVSASAAVNAAAGWPSWMAINSDFGYVPRQLCGLATFGLAIWFMSFVVARMATPAAAPVTTLTLARGRVPWLRRTHAFSSHASGQAPPSSSRTSSSSG